MVFQVLMLLRIKKSGKSYVSLSVFVVVVVEVGCSGLSYASP